MKRLMMITLIAGYASTVSAQGTDDALRFNESNVMGSSRSIAMGGAFGALGADLSSAAINPAGLGAYRASEASMTLGINFNEIKTLQKFDPKEDDLNVERSDDKISVPFNQIGVTFTSMLSREATQGVVGMTFGVAYNRLADYTSNAYFRCDEQYNSLLDHFVYNVNDDFGGGLAYDNGMIVGLVDDDNNFLYNINDWENVDENGDPVREATINQWKYLRKRGYKGEFDFSYAINISHKLYLGATIGVQSYYYDEKSLHCETYNGTAYSGRNDFDYETRLTQDGTGINFKIGAIFKPVSFVRLGIAVHTPTFMSINEDYDATFTSYDERNYYRTESPYGEYEYNYRTPGRLIASAAFVVANQGLLSFDYDYSNYSNGKFDAKSDSYDNFDSNNSEVESQLDAVHTIRIGAEWKVIDEFFLRAGFRTSSAPIKDRVGSLKLIDHSMKDNTASFGFGYRSNAFFIDMACALTSRQGNHIVFPTCEYDSKMEMAKVKTSNTLVSATFGFRF